MEVHRLWILAYQTYNTYMMVWIMQCGSKGGSNFLRKFGFSDCNDFYCPQQSCGNLMFSQVYVKSGMHAVGGSMWEKEGVHDMGYDTKRYGG